MHGEHAYKIRATVGESELPSLEANVRVQAKEEMLVTVTATLKAKPQESERPREVEIATEVHAGSPVVPKPPAILRIVPYVLAIAVSCAVVIGIRRSKQRADAENQRREQWARDRAMAKALDRGRADDWMH
jgi:hypothetical protein